MTFAKSKSAVGFLIFVGMGMQATHAKAASCTTQSQMTSVQRDELANKIRSLLSQIQSDDIEVLRNGVTPTLAANFDGIANSINHLQPLVKSAAITVNELYVLETSNNSAEATRTDFFCGSPLVTLSFPTLPTGVYSLAIVHATGVPHPQQISLMLSKSTDQRWLLAGFFVKPMTAQGHDGLWYWVAARRYAYAKMPWNAWFYYHVATNLLDPLDFLSSPNLEKLQRESEQIRPADLPGKLPMTLNAQGGAMIVTAIDTSTELGELDLDVRYAPDGVQAEQLRDPVSARRQVIAVMSALFRLHPEIQEAFHGIWVHADQGTTSLFALELPMDQIAALSVPQTALQGSISR